MPPRTLVPPDLQVARMYEMLAGAWGPQHWWPAQSRFEVIVGAFLTQNTNWSNVESAIGMLKGAGVLSVAGIRAIPIGELQQLIRSSGYFRQKAGRLKNFVQFLDRSYGGSLTRMFAQPTQALREQLLSLNGVGPETADSILLYAGQHPIVVVDTYTRRIAARHWLVQEQAKYDEVRTLFESGLSEVKTPLSRGNYQTGGAAHSPSKMSLAKRSPAAQVFNEMHGLIVGVAKKYCLKSKPDCDQCPLKPLLNA